ncbi:vascular endothelial growth factor A-A-like isoform X2 [Myxocyprinus asiaticus]|uniref:vascular endothelial growth factor A-A-like isoform X2 n=1 Tax=Myxocyprinus asiaticus TaxID=70543 RepID=UPI002223CA57|nr:vascular endothelial growth factor A-A-like isoform X2 [Myxocyprinus asiaticus]
MSNLFSETFTDAIAEVRLSSDRILKRFIRFINSIMNFAVRVLQLFLVTLLYFSAVKSAYIPKEGGRSTNDVVPFMEVYNKSVCRPREVLVEIQQEYPDDIEHIFIPSCVVLTRCAGCCSDEMMECTPTITYNITLEIKRVKQLRHQGNFFMSFAEHSECQCRVKKEVSEKRENSQCEPCCSTCSERRRRLFVQDSETCQCSCKHSEADCRSRQLELNERTCRWDEPVDVSSVPMEYHDLIGVFRTYPAHQTSAPTAAREWAFCQGREVQVPCSIGNPSGIHRVTGGDLGRPS